MAKKPITIKGEFPKAAYLVLVPFGEFLNKQLQEAQNGDVVVLNRDWRKEKFVLLSIAKIGVNTAYFTQLMRATYGQEMTWQKLSERWDVELLLDGYNSKTWYHDRVLCLSLQPISEEAYNARLEAENRKQQRAEELAYSVTLTLEEIRECIQRGEIPPHKDLL